MKTHALVAVLALSSILVACGERSESPIKTGTTGALTAPTAAAPPAAPDRETPAAATPLTHAQAPQAEAAPQTEAAAAAPTARDTPAAGPLKEMTAAEESNSMPKPGQVNNYSTPATQGELKGTQQSSGTPPPATPAPAK